MSQEPEGVAVVSMACRFPGARSPEEFIENLCRGLDSVLPEAAWPRETDAGAATRAPKAGRAAGILEGIDLLDAAYFGLTPREAEVMDPQQRLFLECAAEALQRAGHETEDDARRVGVYGGMGVNAYFLRHVYPNPRVMEGAGAFQAIASNEKDFFATQVAYRLGLTGPAVTVQTACSTSLVAVAMACEALVGHQCDVALAGGASVKPDPAYGSFLEEGGIAATDGKCRAYDADAKGTIGGSGVGVVVLKRLADALAEGDVIHAVIKGWAVNNDGARKPGFSAPSVEGQAAVIREAQAMAGVAPDTVTYVEGHGTGTPVGDPIEVAALTKAFAGAGRRGSCALGSLKTNVGHLDAAAGVAGLIKTALALERRVLPPTLHFARANPACRLEEGPFYVNATLLPWPAGPTPRRAGVSAFGIGGTNAHLVVEEAPARPSASVPDARPQVLTLSARTPTALDAMAAQLADALEQRPDVALADAAWTLQAGRRRHAHRRAVLARTREEAVLALRGRGAPRATLAQASEQRDRAVAFLFAGQGAQHVQMARGLYESEPHFRAEVDRACDLLRPHLGLDLRDVLFPAPEKAEEAARRLAETALTQPALFVVEHALARLWMRWGLKPRALLGHSLGEYVAACLAGVFTLEDALRLVAARGRLMGETAEGAMLGVALPEADARALLTPGLALAAVNGSAACVVSGEPGEIAALQARLDARGVPARRLAVTRAFHSATMEPILARFEEIVRGVRLDPPRLPVYSNLTGQPLTAAEATDPAYWVRHLRGTVRFMDGLRALAKDPTLALLEVGPGRTLTSLAARELPGGEGRLAVASMRHADDAAADDATTLREALARLWLAGATPDWKGVHAPARRRVVALPAYPFERRRHWLDPLLPAAAAPAPREASRVVEVATPTTLAVPGPDTPEAQASTAAFQRPDLPTPYAAPEGPLEETLVAIWEDLFGFRGIGARDDFFDLGGHSLLATRLVARIRETFEVEIALPRLFEARTVADLARAVEEALVAKLEGMSEEEARAALEKAG